MAAILRFSLKLSYGRLEQIFVNNTDKFRDTALQLMLDEKFGYDDVELLIMGFHNLNHTKKKLRIKMLMDKINDLDDETFLQFIRKWQKQFQNDELLSIKSSWKILIQYIKEKKGNEPVKFKYSINNTIKLNELEKYIISLKLKQKTNIQKLDEIEYSNIIESFNLDGINKILIQGNPSIGKTIHSKSLIDSWIACENYEISEKLLLYLDVSIMDNDDDDDLVGEIFRQNFSLQDFPEFHESILKLLYKEKHSNIILLIDNIEKFQLSRFKSLDKYLNKRICNFKTIVWSRKQDNLDKDIIFNTVFELEYLSIDQQYNLYQKYLKDLKREEIKRLRIILEEKRLKDLSGIPHIANIISSIWPKVFQILEKNSYKLYDYLYDYNNFISKKQNILNETEKYEFFRKCFIKFTKNIDFSYNLIYAHKIQNTFPIFLFIIQNGDKIKIKFHLNSFLEYFISKFLINELEKTKRNNEKINKFYEITELDKLYELNDSNLFKILGFIGKYSKDDYQQIVSYLNENSATYKTNLNLQNLLEDDNIQSNIVLINEIINKPNLQAFFELSNTKITEVTFLNCDELKISQIFTELSKFCSELKILTIQSNKEQYFKKFEYNLIELVKLVKNTKIEKLNIDNFNFTVFFDEININTDKNTYSDYLILGNKLENYGLKLDLDYKDNKLITIKYDSISNLTELTKGFIKFLKNYEPIQNLIICKKIFTKKIWEKFFKVIKSKDTNPPLLQDCEIIEPNDKFFRYCYEFIEPNYTVEMDNLDFSYLNNKYGIDKFIDSDRFFTIKNKLHKLTIGVTGDEIRFFLNSYLNNQDTEVDCPRYKSGNLNNILKFIIDALNSDIITMLDLPIFLTKSSCSQYIVKDLLETVNQKIKKIKLEGNTTSNEKSKILLGYITSRKYVEKIEINNYDIQQFIHNFQKIIQISANNIKFIQFKNLIISEEISKMMINCFNSLKILKSLQLINLKFYGNGLQNLWSGLRNVKNSIESLTIDNCYLNKNDCFIVKKLLNQLSALKFLRLSKNNCLDYEFIDIFDGFRKESIKLEKLCLPDCNLNYFKQIQSLNGFLCNTNNIIDINLSGNSLIHQKVIQIFENLKKSSKNLKSINLNNCKLNEKFLSSLADLFQNCTNLEFINLSKNFISKKNCKQLFNSLKSSSKTLKSLIISKCNIQIDDENSLKNFLSVCHCLVNFDISCNLLFNDNRGKDIIGSLQSSAKTLRTLNLSQCKMNKECIKEFSKLYKNLHNPQAIILKGNREIGENFNLFCDFSKFHPKNLFLLDISSCKLTTYSPESIMNFFLLFKNLSYLDISYNGNFIKEIMEGLTGSSSLFINVLIMRSCNINDKNRIGLQRLLRYCSSLNSIDLSSNRKLGSHTEKKLYVEYDCNIFSEITISSSILQTIKLSSCNLSEKDGYNLANLLGYCIRLREIDISKNPNLGDGLDKIFFELKKCSLNLVNLNVYKCLIKSNYEKNFVILLSSAHQLEKVYLSVSDDRTCEFIKEICEGLGYSHKTLKTLKFSASMGKSDNQFMIDLLLKCHFLNTLDLKIRKELVKDIVKTIVLRTKSSKISVHDLKLFPWLIKAREKLFTEKIPISASTNEYCFKNEEEQWNSLIESAQNYHRLKIPKLNFLDVISNEENDNSRNNLFFKLFYMPLKLREIYPRIKQNHITDINFIKDINLKTENICIVGNAQIGKTVLLNRILYCWSELKNILQDYLILKLPYENIDKRKSLIENLWYFNYGQSYNDLREAFQYFCKNDHSYQILVLIDDGEEFIEDPLSYIPESLFKLPLKSFQKIIFVRSINIPCIYLNNVYEIQGIQPEANVRCLKQIVRPKLDEILIQKLANEFYSLLRTNNNLYDLCQHPLCGIIVFSIFMNNHNKSYSIIDDSIPRFLMELRKNKKSHYKYYIEENDFLMNFFKILTNSKLDELLSIGFVNYSSENFSKFMNNTNIYFPSKSIEIYFTKKFLRSKHYFPSRLKLEQIFHVRNNFNENISFYDWSSSEVPACLYVFKKHIFHIQDIKIKYEKYNKILIIFKISTKNNQFVTFKSSFRETEYFSIFTSNFFTQMKYLIENTIFPENFQKLSRKSIQYHLSNYNVGVYNFKGMLKNLGSNYFICTEIYLKNADVDENSYLALVNFFKTQSSIKIIDLSENDLGNSKFLDIMDSLQSCLDTLEEIIICSIGIDDNLSKELKNFLIKSSNIHLIDISRNRIQKKFIDKYLNIQKITIKINDLFR